MVFLNFFFCCLYFKENAIAFVSLFGHFFSFFVVIFIFFLMGDIVYEVRSD